MAKTSQNRKLIGLVLLAVGVGLAIWGFQQSESFGSQLNEALTGSHTNKVMLLYIGAAAAVVAGLFLVTRK